MDGSGARAVYDGGEAFPVHAAHDSDEPRPGYRGERDLAVLPHQEDGFVAVELLDVEIECPREDRRRRGGRAGKGERRAADERRMLVAEGDVVERRQVDEALEGVEAVAIRVRNECRGSGRELAPPRRVHRRAE